ncbi:MAG: hypothetical protein ACJAYR_003549 [Sneathiella sp.]
MCPHSFVKEKILKRRTATFLTLATILAFGAQAVPTSYAASESNLSGKEIARVVFSEIEKRIIDDYFKDHSESLKNEKKKGKKKGLPPGLAKKEQLPPGLQKQLERNGTLPPGLQKRSLPDDLLSRLPKRNSRFDRVIVDNDIVLLERGTNLILDILKGAAK